MLARVQYQTRCYIFLAIILCSLISRAQSPVAKNGVLDLRNYSFDTHGSIELEGEWIFYWKQLIFYKQQIQDTQKHFISLPQLWNDQKWNAEKLGGDGYASFQLKLLLPPQKKIYSLDVPYMYTAYRLYIDSMLLSENGIVSTTAEDHRSRFMPGTVNFQSEGGEANIIIQVSNFDDRKGGIWKAPQLGSPERIAFSNTKNLALEFFIIGALVLIGFYQIGLSFIRKEDFSSLYFGLFCLMMGINSLFVGSVFINYIFPGMSWQWVSRLEYISMYAMPMLFFLFINSLFPGYVQKSIPSILIAITLAASLFICFTHKKTFGILLEFLLVMLVAMAFFIIRIVIKAIKDKRHGSRNALAGIIILLVFTLNDVFYGMELIKTGTYRQYGLLIFVVIQSLNIAYIFSQAFDDVKKLTKNLKLTNVSLSRFVPEEFLRFLGKNNILSVQLGDQKKADMSILFIDIRSFTTLSEKLSPKDNFHFINSYLSKVSPVIRLHNGFVDKYIGDAIMALFPDKADDAIDAAQGILLQLQQYNKQLGEQGINAIRVGMGLHTGSVMLGTVGEEQRMDTTVISDTVNLASRLEGLSKIFDLQIVTTLSTVKTLDQKNIFTYRIIHKGRVKGKNEPVTLVEIIHEETDPLFEQKKSTAALYATAMDLYEQGKIAEALEQFSLVAEVLPADKPTLYYLRLCKRYVHEKIPADWTGIESLDVRSVEF